MGGNGAGTKPCLGWLRDPAADEGHPQRLLQVGLAVHDLRYNQAQAEPDGQVGKQLSVHSTRIFCMLTILEPSPPGPHNAQLRSTR